MREAPPSSPFHEPKPLPLARAGTVLLRVMPTCTLSRQHRTNTSKKTKKEISNSEQVRLGLVLSSSSKNIGNYRQKKGSCPFGSPFCLVDVARIYAARYGYAGAHSKRRLSVPLEL